MGFEPVKEVNVIDVYEIYHYYKNCRNEIKMKFQIIDSSICDASTLLETKENKM